MQILFYLILIFCFIASGLAASYIGYYGDPAHPGKCVLNGLILSPGEVHDDPIKCEKTSCEKNSWSSFSSCGVFKPPDGCKLGKPIHRYAPYPDCCERHIICNTI